MAQEAVRDKIVEAAGEAFFQDGFRAVTMDELAGQLRMSKRTLYRHFDSKKDLLRHILLRRFRHIDTVLLQAAEDEYPDFPHKLRTVLKRLAEALPQPSRRFFRDLRQSAPDVWQELMEERKRILVAHFRPLFEEGRRRGVLRPDLETDFVLQLFLSMLQGLINPQVLSELPLTAPQVLERIVAVLMTGILSPAARIEASGTNPLQIEGQS